MRKMAKKINKTVDMRIEDKKLEIVETESKLLQLNGELKELYNEKDNLEMHEMFKYCKENNLTLEEIKVQLNKKKSA